MRDPAARPIGTLWRSDGRLVTGDDGKQEVTCTWRAYLPDAYQGDTRVPGAEVARGASHADAVAALLVAGGE